MAQTAAELKSTLEKGSWRTPFWIVGPCVIENRDLLATIAERVREISEKHKIPVVFKASFDKANRTSFRSFRGPGLEEGLSSLLWVKEQFGLPVLTDIHESHQAAAIAEVADIIQIPALLCRQTDLLKAAADTGRAINIKKGQFIDPASVAHIANKMTSFKNENFWITERGASFGYQRLVVDFAAFEEMRKCGASFILDITHAVQLPGAAKEATGGNRNAVPLLARAGAAIGMSGFFAETHPNPNEALSDGPNAWPLDSLESLMVKVKEIAHCAHE